MVHVTFALQVTLARSAKHLLPPVDDTLKKAYSQARPPTPKNKKRKLSVSSPKMLASPFESTSANLISGILLVNDRMGGHRKMRRFFLRVSLASLTRMSCLKLMRLGPSIRRYCQGRTVPWWAPLSRTEHCWTSSKVGRKTIVKEMHMGHLKFLAAEGFGFVSSEHLGDPN